MTQAVQAEALRDAATEIQINTWTDLFEGPITQKIGNAQRVVDWLRVRADQLEESA